MFLQANVFMRIAQVGDLEFGWSTHNNFHGVDCLFVFFVRRFLFGSEYLMFFRKFRTDQNCLKNEIEQSSS